MSEVIDRLELKVMNAKKLNTVNSMPPSSYAEIILGTDLKRTKIIPDDITPDWEGKPTIIFTQLVSNDLDCLRVYIRHKDVFTGKDTPLGVAVIDLATAYGSPNMEIDDWYKLFPTSDMKETPTGEIHLKMTYFNSIDDDVVMSVSQLTPERPNLLQIKIVDAGNFSAKTGPIDGYVVAQVGDLRKESKMAKKSTNPTWDEVLEIPTSNEIDAIDLVVRHASILRGVFLGRCCIAMNEVASCGDAGFRKSVTLLNENFELVGSGNGFLQVHIKWIFDKATDDQNKAPKSKNSGLLSRLSNMLMPSKKSTVEEEKEEKKDEDLLEEDEEGGLNDMSPFELAQYMDEQRKKRREEMDHLLQIPEEELELPDGDYQVIVNIVEITQVKSNNSSGLTDPIVYVEVNGQRQHTKVVYKVAGCVYDETFYFNFKDFKREQIAEAHLKLNLYNHNMFWPNDYLGTYEVDLLSIYNSRDHELYRTWGAFRDPISKEDSGVKGLVKFSVVVLGPGDQLKDHDPSKDLDEEELDLDVTEGAKPPSSGSGNITQSEHFLVIGVLRVEGLPGYDRILSSVKTGLYTFVSVEFAGCKPIKTSKVAVSGKKNLTVTFEEEIWIPVWVPSMCKRAALTVINREFGRGDQVIATAYIDFEMIAKCEYDPLVSDGFFGFGRKKYNGPALQWVHLYGANPTVRAGSKEAKFMNRFPNYGSAYRGSMLCSMRIVKNSNIEGARRKAMSYDIPEALIPKGAVYMLRIMIYQGSDFGSSGYNSGSGGLTKYSVGINIGPYEIQSSFRAYEHGSCDWVQLLEKDNLALPLDLKMMPDTFITIYKGTENSFKSVAFTRLKTVQLMDKGIDNSFATWYELQHDQSHKSTPKIGYPGSVLLRTAFVNREDIEDETDWESERKKMEAKKPFCLRVFIYQCRQLPPFDETGLIDPYVKVRFAGSKSKTQVKKSTQNPAYYECLEFTQMLPADLRLAPNIIIQVWDYKTFSQTPICAVRYKTSDVPLVKSLVAGPKTPEWLDLHGIDGKQSMGQVLVSFQLIEKEKGLQQNLPRPKDITPSLKKVWLDMHVIGCRGLQKVGRGKIRKPYLQFDVCSSSYGDSMKTVSSHNPQPSSPNYLERYIMMTMMPEDPLFTPTLEVRCFDPRVGSKVLLGTCQINLASKCPWNGTEYTPPRQHVVMISNIKARKALADAKAAIKDAAKKNKEEPKKQDEEEEDDKPPVPAKVDDIGLGVFPPEEGALEQGAKYLELPTILDAEEVEQMKMKKKKENDKLGLNPDDSMADLDSGSKMDDLKKYIGFPTAWANSDYLKGREWWIQSKKRGEGGNLEEYMKTYPFENYDFYRGHIIFNKYGKRKDTTRKIGLLKAVIRVCVKNPRYDDEYNKFAKSIRQTSKCVVRVYIIKATNLQPMHWLSGKANPYLRVSLGEKEFKDVKSMVKSTLTPDFFSVYEFQTTLPGPSSLKIQVWDHHRFIGSDQIMGESVIDLEDRWCHPQWTSIGDNKPVEVRNIYKSGNQTSQGLMLMWVDIYTVQDAQSIPKVEISGPEKLPFEIRCVVWRSQNVFGKGGGVVDAFVTLYMEGTSERYHTDTHWRLKNGKGSWNWRLKIPIELPIKARELGRLKIQMWNRNIISSNEIIGEATVNIYDWLMLCYKRREAPVEIYKETRDAERRRAKGILPEGAEGIDVLSEFDAMAQEEEEEEEEEVPNDDDFDGEEGDGEEAPLLKKEEGKEGEADKKKEDPKANGAQEEEEEDDVPKKADDDEEEESDTTKLLNTINTFLGLGDTIDENGTWLTLTYHDKKTNKLQNKGRLAISLAIVPQSEVKARPVGNGRDEPNQNPMCPPPFGRFSFNFNPFSLLAELCGPSVICCIVCCCCCCCLLATFMFVSSYLSGLYSMEQMFS